MTTASGGAGDKVFVEVYAHNSTTIFSSVYDISSGNLVYQYDNTGKQLPYTDAESLVFLYKACDNIATGFCPQVDYINAIEFGSYYVGNGSYCYSSNGTQVPSPCYYDGNFRGNLAKYTARPIGKPKEYSGFVTYEYKLFMFEGDLSGHHKYAGMTRLYQHSSYEVYFLRS